MAVVCVLLTAYYMAIDEDTAAAVLSGVFLVCLFFGIYYGNLEGARRRREDRDAYEKAIYYQARKKTMKVITGGKK